MSDRRFTDQEMREASTAIYERGDELTTEEMLAFSAMLRYAAGVVEQYDAAVKLLDDELIKQKHCRNCEWRGKTIRSEPACPCDEDVHGVVFDIDLTDRIVKALRGDAGKNALAAILEKTKTKGE